jgi:hypothetical protein
MAGPAKTMGDAFVPGLGEKFAGVPVRLGFGAGLHFAGHAHFTAERDPGHAITGFPPLKAEHFRAEAERKPVDLDAGFFRHDEVAEFVNENHQSEGEHHPQRTDHK